MKNYRCKNCGACIRLAKKPSFCPFCASPDIDRDNAEARENALQLIESCDELAAEMEPLYNAYIEKMAHYEWNMQTLRCYKKRGIVTEDEMPKYKKPPFQAALAEYRRHRKENSVE